MPRVAIKKKEYMILDMPHELVKEAKKKGIHQKDLAAAIRITPQAFHQRIGKDEKGEPKDVFSYGDLLTLFKMLDLSDEEIVKFMRM